MNQNKNRDKRCSDICRKIFCAIRQIAWGGEAPNSAHSEADPSAKALDIQSKPEGGRRIALVLENGEGKSSASDLPDNQVAIVAARTIPVKTPGQQGPGQSAKIAAVTQPGSNTVVTHGERANEPKLESTLGADHERNGSGHDMDHRFSDYISRTWLKIRSMSNVGRGGGGRGFSSK